MNQFSVPLFKYLLLVITSYVFIYILGHFFSYLINLKSKSQYVVFFEKLTLGVIGLVTIYALYRTNFNSIYFISLILLFFMFLKQYNEMSKKKISDIFQIEYKNLFVSLIVLVVFFLIAYYFFYLNLNGAVFGDNCFYANISDHLNNSGIETTDFDWTVSNQIVNPYHYTEVWFVAFFSNLFVLNSISVYYLFYVPIFITIVFQGAISLAYIYLEKSNIKNLQIYLYSSAIIFLILQNFEIPLNSNLIIQKYFYVGTVFHNIKFLIVYILFLLSTILIVENKYKISFFFLLMIIPFYSTVAPAILSGITTLLIYLYFSKKVTLSSFFKYQIIVVFIAFCYMLFYYLKSNKSGVEQLHYLSTSILFIPKVTSVYVKLFIFGIFPPLILFGTLLFLKNKFYDFYRNYKIYFWSFFYFFIGSIISIYIILPMYLNFNHDAFQLLSNFTTPFLIITFFMLMLFVIKNHIKYRFISLLVFLVYFGYLTVKNPSISFNMANLQFLEPKVDEFYFSEIHKQIDKYPRGKFAYFRNYKDKHLMEYKPFLFVPDNRIIHFRNNYTPLCLSPLQIPNNIDIRYCNVSDFAFYRYVENKRLKYGFINIDVCYSEFIILNNIKFITTENGTKLPNSLLKFTSKTIYNNINGNTFYCLSLSVK